MQRLLVLNPSQRLTVSQALQHPFFNEITSMICNGPNGFPAFDWRHLIHSLEEDQVCLSCIRLMHDVVAGLLFLVEMRIRIERTHLFCFVLFCFGLVFSLASSAAVQVQTISSFMSNAACTG